MEASRAAGRAGRFPRGGRPLGLLLALVLSVGLAACGGADEGPSQRPLPAEEGEGAADLSISRRLPANFALLRTPPEGIPAEVRQTLRAPVRGMRWSLARRISIPLPGTYWLVPGVGHLCIVATTPDSPAVGTVCASVEEALRHSVANVSLDKRSGERLIVGVAPDGARRVVVRSGVSTSSARVREGNFVLRDSVSAPPDELMLR
jgi:hypothetical protein